MLNFENRDIAPYGVVPVGKLDPGDIAAEPQACEPSVEVKLERRVKPRVSTIYSEGRAS